MVPFQCELRKLTLTGREESEEEEEAVAVEEEPIGGRGG